MMRVGLGVAAAIVLSVCVPCAARAATITVTSLTAADGVDAICTLNEAMARATGSASPPECEPAGPAGVLVVQLPAGTATITAATSSYAAAWPAFAGTIVIRGAGAGMTIIRNDAASPTRLFTVLAGGDVTLEAMTVERFNGEPGDASGGAIFLLPNGALTLRNTTFRDGSTSSAGSVLSAPFPSASATTRLTIEGSTFVGNTSVLGTTLYVYDVTLTIDGSTFTANRGGSSNGLEHLTSGVTHTATIRDTMFTDNVSTGDVGAAIFRGPAPVTLEGSTFDGNEATGAGGAVMAESPLTVRMSTFIENRSNVSYGGAIYSGATFTIADSRFTGNYTATNGGAIYAGYAVGLVERCRFERNTAEDGGAIVHHGAEVVTVLDSVFVDNDVPVTGVTIEATDDRATEGGDTGSFTVGRTSVGSAIRASAPMVIHGSCFVGGVREIISTYVTSVDATGNYWTATDPRVRGDERVDTSSPLATPPAGCDPSAPLTLGELPLESSVSGTATPDDDYVAISVPLVFRPGESDIVVPVAARLDDVADPDETVNLEVTFRGTGNTSTVRITDAIAADVSIVKTADVGSAAVGDTVVFTLTVANAGPGAAADLVVTDALPTGLTLVDASIDAPSGTDASCIPGAPVSCTISTLAAGASATVTVRTMVTAAEDITNRAELASAADPDPSNDSSEVIVRSAGDDGGVPASDGGTDDGGGVALDAGVDVDGGRTVVSTGGCGCRAGGSSSRGIALATLLGLPLLVRRRRRR